MYLNIKTEFSFKNTFGHIKDIIKKVKIASFAGIADLNNTFGFVPWEKACTEAKIMPVFGVVLPVCIDLEEKNRRGHLNNMTLIAKTQKGFSSINKCVDVAYSQFWYVPRLTFEQVNNLDRNHVIIISGFAPKMEFFTKPIYQQISSWFPKFGINKDLQPIACIDNNYINIEDKEVYETFAHSSAPGQPGFNQQTYLQHIPTYKEFENKQALKNMLNLVKTIEEVKLQKAPLLKYRDENPKALLEKLCQSGAIKKDINLEKKKYKKRYEKELKLISEKGFIDYFLVVADLIEKSKEKMLVGPGRGSSGGSLVCFLLGVTNVDPIKYDLIFERFIDINRTDLPDIDIDFQDNKRDFVLRYLSQKYHVAQIANISRLTPKANLNRVAKALSIPEYELTEVKNLTSDVKADSITVEKILTDTDPGKNLIRKYKHVQDCIPLENHALHSSIHAAGIIACNEPVTNFVATIQSRRKEDDKTHVACVDMAGCEYLNLLKIDALGLKTLTVLSETCDRLGFPYEWLYNVKDGDKKAYKIINSGKLTGVFQFEGRAIQGITSGLKLSSVQELAAISALGRPGPMKSGASSKYTKRKTGQQDVDFPDNHKTIKKILAPTYGVIVYQEQIMAIARNYSCMKWENVIKLRKVIGKSKGTEELKKFREMFINGAKGKNPEKVWDMIKTFGSYGFNKSHAIAYAIITYWCAYLKAYYPLEFAVATLNNTEDDNKAVNILRYLREEEKIKHVAFDVDESLEKWSVSKNKIVGGFMSIHGIGIQSARRIIKARQAGEDLPPGIQKHLDVGKTPFKYLYPRKQLYKSWPGTNIENIKESRKYEVVGKLIKMKLKDANSVENVNNRGKEVNGPTTYLNIIIADDTGEMMCIINRFNYENLGREIPENSKENETWFFISGNYEKRLNILFIDDIEDITI